ncbi:MAG: hypothetical protein QOG63_1111 [Thermoleophilaceae bacterium]|nr:hypothetical protein [Thermoleophilaceae bacterium]
MCPVGEARVSAYLRDERRQLAALFAWCALIAVVDWRIAHSAVLLGFLATGPLIAAALARPRIAAAVGVWAVALAVALGDPDMIFGTTDHLVRVFIVASIALLSVWLASTRAGLEQARVRDRLIADAGAVMSNALDYEVALIELARLCARRLSDWCFVFLSEDDGSVRQVAVAHVDPDRQRLAWELLLRYPLNPDRSEGPARVIRSGEAELVRDVDDRVLRAMSAGDENLRMLKALGLRSAMIVPLIARGRILGAVAFASADSGRVFERDDLSLAEALTGRAAVIVDNARLYVQLREAETELRASHVQLEAILGGVADSVTAQRPDGQLVYANDAAARLLGLGTAEELMNADVRELAARYVLIGEDGRPFPLEELPGRRALRGEDPEPALVRYRNARTGEEHWSQIKATAIRDESGEPVLAINVIEDVTDQREREETQRFLADVGAALTGSLDVDETLPRVARLAARQLADWCAIEVVEADGMMRTVAVAGADRENGSHAEELMRRYPASGFLSGPLSEGRSLLQPELDDAALATLARDPEHLALLRMLRPRSALSVPLALHGRVLGVVSLFTAESGRRLDADDLLLAEIMAGRCALALDNSRLYEERSRIARTLQASLLPPLLPDLPGLDVAARFRAAGAGIEVGGDFYDLFELGDAGWAVAIGDVCGKGTGAAAVTALARYTVRAAAMRQEDPSQILALLNTALLTQRDDRRFATVLFGRLASNGHDGSVSFEFSSGGHPLPLLLSGNGGGGREVGAPGTLLGIVGDPALGDHEVTLGPGDAVVLYTDGVTDAGAPEHVWTPLELAAAVGPTKGLGADAIAELMLRAALDATDAEPRDDIAIIVLKVPEGEAT